MNRAAVYLATDRAGLIKVGASNWGMRRLATLYSPVIGARYGILCTDPHPLAYKVEAKIKRTLAPKRFKGEWFAVGESEATAVLKWSWAAVTDEQCVYRISCEHCSGFGTTQFGRCPDCGGKGLEAEAKIVDLRRRK